MNINQRDWQKLVDEVTVLKRNLCEYKSVEYSLSDGVSTAGGGVCFEIFALCESHAVINAETDALYSGGVISVLVNGAFFGTFGAGGINKFTFDCVFKSGKNEITFLSQGDLSSLRIHAFGLIYKKDYGSRVYPVFLQNANLVALKNGASGEFKIFNANDLSSPIFTSVQPVCAASALEGDNFVCVYGDGRNMSAVIMNKTGTALSDVLAFEANSDGFTKATDGGGAAFYSAEKGKITKYVFDDLLNLTVTETGVEGREIFDCGDNVFTVVGFDDRAKFVDRN